MMTQFTLELVDSPARRNTARELITEYLRWVATIAASEHGLSFDVDAMVRSDTEDRDKFFPPRGRLYLVCQGCDAVAVGALKSLVRDVGEIQRMYVRPQARGLG